MNISFLKMVSADISILRSCASLYCEIWKEAPWNENWIAKKVLKSIKNQSKRGGFDGFIALSNDKVIGFAWGYLVSRDNIRVISGDKKLDFVFSNNEKVFYLAELGVSYRFRKKGIGGKLTDILLSKISQNIILRTDKRANRAKKLYFKKGFKELAVNDNRHKDRIYWFK